MLGMDTNQLIAPPLAGNVLGSVQNDFIVAEWQDAGGPAGPPRYIAPLHLHRSDDEAWYVLEGVLCVRQGDTVVEVRAGSGILVPKGTLHTYWNPSAERTRYLLLMTPGIYGLIRGIHEMTERSPERIRALFEKFDSVLA